MSHEKLVSIRQDVDPNSFQTSKSNFIEGDKEIGYAALMTIMDEQMQDVDSSFIALSAGSNLVSVAMILWGMRNQKSLILLDPEYSRSHVDELIQKFKPTVYVNGMDASAIDWSSFGWKLNIKKLDTLQNVFDPQVLLSTSGTTGNPRHVRLGLPGVVANAKAIVKSIELLETDSTIVNLAPHYSYGLSVITSGVISGIDFHFVKSSFTEQTFWDYVATNKITYLSGVPFFWESLLRMKWNLASHTSLRKLTQAGGRLSVSAQEKIINQCNLANCEFRVMYGQTEAGPRMTIMEWPTSVEKIGSVGKPIDGGRIEIENPDTNGVGEVVFTGPSVMLGYADELRDLYLGDTTKSILKTGDLGYVDTEQHLWITGRIKRIAKLNGTRINLDDMEKHFSTLGSFYAVSNSAKIVMFHLHDIEFSETEFKNLAQRLGLNHRLIESRGIDQIPVLSNGKIDYQSLVGRLNE